MSTQIATIEATSRIIWRHQSAPAPTTAVRGDWTGDRRADLLGIKGDELFLFPAGSDGRLGAPRSIGRGWAGYSWIGSPGDVTRDGRSDLLARDAEGNLQLFKGTGNGTLTTVRQVGKGWNSLTAITAAGDFDADGTPDVLARTSGGDLMRYAVPSSGGAVPKGRVGTGWGAMKAIVGLTGLNTDSRADVLAIRNDQKMFAYTSSGKALQGGREVGHGWSPTLVTSPGNLTGNGNDDLAFQNGARLLSYPVSTSGTIGSPVTNPGSAAGFRLLA